VQGATAGDQPLNLNLSERRGTARLMSAWDLYAEAQGFEGDDGLRSDRRWRFKGDDVRNRTGGGRATKRAVRELEVISRVVVRMMCGHLRGEGCRADLQQKRLTVRRHEADGHIGAKQEGYQQQAGEQVASPGMK
jgi:hypothetical protein